MNARTPPQILDFDTTSLDWIALGPGAWYKPVRFAADGEAWVSLVRLAPGTAVPRHRHVGAVQGFNLQGRGRFIEDDLVTTPGTYTLEPAGTIDTLVAEGDEDLIMLFTVDGPVEYLDADEQIARRETQETKISSFEQSASNATELKVVRV
ncbi:2,4'-dihydroxyacetophenone dioxygenase family protein [Pusillimonas noertemannii]|uniref:2,4'-dihydroxyacetophenone dioxygenase family protein n=1 Tax=Pusillimonas noertemannii TaxID=305977 RepID=UPI0002EC3FBC|nr:2,4'-dihydroxyacetophenone dioxygenase family protein [Pusillimonas noertemannii]